ncbi:MAG TPA: hypothetical protein VGO62_04300, partial [Myxococcota bacterium]
ALWVGVLLVLPSACLVSPTPPPAEDTAGVDAVEPLTPDQGFQFHIDPFEVPGGTEVQDCYFVAVPDINHGQDVWINRFKMGQRPGSHHFTVFRVNTIYDLGGQAGDVVRGGECRISTNWSDWPLVVNSQESETGTADFDWDLPDGVAQRFHPGELLMLQTHYVNANIQKTAAGGEARINFYKSSDANPIEMGTLFATQQSIRICESAPTVSYSGTCSFPPGQDIHIAAANGHAHSRLTSLDMFTWDGTTIDHPAESARFYESLHWDEPPMSTDLTAVTPSGGGVWWDCNYQWHEPAVGCDLVNARDHEQADDCCYTFGNAAEVAEHCNIFVYYWPKVDDQSIFCD